MVAHPGLVFPVKRPGAIQALSASEGIPLAAQ